MKFLSRIDRLEQRIAAWPGPGRSRPPEPRPFGLDWMRQFLGHYLTAPPSRLHLDLADDLRDLHTRRGSWRNYKAPRGGAKTTWLTKGYGLYCAAEGVERYVLILSDTGDQAVSFLTAVKEELEANPLLAEAYPYACGVGPIWRQNRIRLRNGVMVEARSAGGRIRGLTSRNERPTLVVVDDANEKADAYSPTLRRRKWEWFTKDVMAVGTATTNVLVAGTPIHREAICHRLVSTPGWVSRSYRSVIRWPDRADLWHEWERTLTNLADPERNRTARDFYEANQSEMDRGAEVLWPERDPLYELMLYRAANGDAAFRSEKQDEPGADGATEWPTEYFERQGFWFEDWPDGIVCKILALDPSKGSDSRAGDWQAHVMLGLRSDGDLYFDAELRREPITDMVRRAVRLAKEWGGVNSVVIEDNGTMGLMRPEVERAGAELKSLLPWETITNTEPKRVRILSVGSYLARGRVRVRNTPGGRALVDQWRDVPNGDSDDACDAAGIALSRLHLLYNARR